MKLLSSLEYSPFFNSTPPIPHILTNKEHFIQPMLLLQLKDYQYIFRQQRNIHCGI